MVGDGGGLGLPDRVFRRTVEKDGLQRVNILYFMIYNERKLRKRFSVIF
jgi:hypothetical protein